MIRGKGNQKNKGGQKGADGKQKENGDPKGDVSSIVLLLITLRLLVFLCWY
jgi:hypothetical protein